MSRSVPLPTRSSYGLAELTKPEDLLSVSALQDRVQPLKDETDDCCARKVQEFLKNIHHVQLLTSATRDATANAAKQILKTQDTAEALHDAVESGDQVRQAVTNVTRSITELGSVRGQLEGDISALTSRNEEIYLDMDKVREMWKEMWNFVSESRKKASILEYDLARLKQNVKIEITAIKKRIQDKAEHLGKLLEEKDLPIWPPRLRVSRDKDLDMEVKQQLRFVPRSTDEKEKEEQGEKKEDECI